MECGVCSANFLLIGGKKGGYYGCSGAHRNGSCENKSLIGIKRVEMTLNDLIKEKLSDSDKINYAIKRYNQALEIKCSVAPRRLEQIEKEIRILEDELKNLIQVIIGGNSSDSINIAIKEREQRKNRLKAETASLKRSSAKPFKISADGIKERLERLSETIALRPLESFPIIRTFFPKKIKLIPEGKSISGQNLYSMKGQFTLNGVIVEIFDKPVTKTNKEEAVKPLPLSFKSSSVREPHNQGFSMYVNGVTNGA